ncbi:MAG: glycosyltransferase family 9 protein [Calditrichia bacterium]
MNRSKYKNILLVRTDRIGDVVLTTPAISLLRENYPDANLYFLTRQYTAPLLSHYKYLQEIIIYRPESIHKGFRGHLQLGRELKSRQIDLALLFYPRPGLALALRAARIKHRVGIGYRWYSFLLNHRIFEHRKYGRRHELEYNLSLMENFIESVPPPGQIKFDFQTDERLNLLRDKALSKLEINTGTDYVVVHPGSGGSAPNLPPAMFARIINYIARNSSLKILLAGSAMEASLINEIAAEAEGDSLTRVIGDWDLETYTSVIAKSRLFISNSTGPMHIARAFNIPLVAFYCPAIPCSPKRWGPYNRPDSVLAPDVEPCKTCNRQTCPHGNCLSHIEWPEIRALLDLRLAIRQE